MSQNSTKVLFLKQKILYRLKFELQKLKSVDWQRAVLINALTLLQQTYSQTRLL